MSVFQAPIASPLHVVWVDSRLHEAAVEAVIAAHRQRLSLVDCTSFAIMRQYGVRTAFAFDRHFAEQGFAVIPER